MTADSLVRDAIVAMISAPLLLVMAPLVAVAGLALVRHGLGSHVAWRRATHSLAVASGAIYFAGLTVVIIWAYVSLGSLPGPGS